MPPPKPPPPPRAFTQCLLSDPKVKWVKSILLNHNKVRQSADICIIHVTYWTYQHLFWDNFIRNTSWLNTLSPRQNECHFTEDISNAFSWNKNIWIRIRISLKFVPRGLINKIPALVQIMAWRCPGDKPLSEPMLVCLQMHICVNRPQWVKTWKSFVNENK